ncbi:lysozyme inhibitor LprI family protein [Stenotrophomonas sp. SY1]|uniref:lysozyme inhibitor LprI family protein n=1 Tax=Stenotrophomonas sp. SY1 TaxID=477235 RepID=UPI001E2F3B5E|nr:lysozyme inhibitor LprI family protein [Stenotrophomonas sp. SY1]MCD9087756.1 lysozyme inhibitor LprI family protein [Stenotrophomonas sp. SY1]
MSRLPLLLLALLPLAASAASPGKACDNARTQLEINECAAQEASAADAELNAVYRQVMQQLQGQPVAVEKLRAAQRLWIPLRDADIAARYPVGKDENPRVLYGSMYPMLYSAAKADLTRQRTQWLRATFIDRAEGDL